MIFEIELCAKVALGAAAFSGFAVPAEDRARVWWPEHGSAACRLRVMGIDPASGLF